MPFVVSHGTLVTGFFNSGVQSVSLTFTPNITRLYQLGFVVPYDENVTLQKQLSVTVYGGETSEYTINPSVDCTDAPTINLSITANGCNGDAFTDTDDWYVNSYSYSKDIQGYGLETWGLISKPINFDGNLNEITDVETRMILGTPEGDKSVDGKANVGLEFRTDHPVIGNNSITAVGFLGDLQVTAGSPGIGRANYMEYGVVQSIGNSTGKHDGRDGRASARIPYQPVYIPL